MKISVIIPVFNEERAISKLLKKIFSLNLDKQIIVVNDGSTDNTLDEINKNKNEIDIIINHSKNLGKGAAIKSASKHLNGEIVIIQDGDLEYDPKDYKSLISPIIKNEALVVYGSRVLGKKRYIDNNEFISLFRTFGNHFLTILSNTFNNQNLTDAHTCYKVFKTEIFKDLDLKENDFSFCPEVTTKLSNKKIKIYEVPISYKGRTAKEGKKIKFIDAIKAFRVILKYKFYKK